MAITPTASLKPYAPVYAGPVDNTEKFADLAAAQAFVATLGTSGSIAYKGKFILTEDTGKRYFISSTGTLVEIANAADLTTINTSISSLQTAVGGKLDKTTTTSTNQQFYAKNADGTQTLIDNNFEQTPNKTSSISSTSTATQYPSAKAVYDYAEAKSNKVTSLSGTSTDTQYPSAKAVFDSSEQKANKTTSLSGTSTDTQYPSAKAVYDFSEQVAHRITVIDSNSTDQQYPTAKAVYDFIYDRQLSLDIVTIAPTANNPEWTLSNGKQKIVLLTAEPAQRYSGYIYIIQPAATGISLQITLTAAASSFVFNSDANSSLTGNSVEYSLDNGNTWVTQVLTSTKTINFGQSVTSFLLKGNLSNKYGTYLNTYAYLFYGNTTLKEVRGVFPVATAVANMFKSTFQGCTGLTEISEILFRTVSGVPAESLFNATFLGCSSLTSIPGKLFQSIVGAPAASLFYQTFRDCTAITDIPANLFQTIVGAPAQQVFFETFRGCTNLSNTIPSNLFQTIVGAPAVAAFSKTFFNCSGLTGTIPAGLFANVSGAPAEQCFYYTFSNCASFTGLAAGLFSGVSGAPAPNMFAGTFLGCSGMTSTIPTGFFAGITGTPAESMFESTFEGCTNLTGNVPSDLFGGISGAPAANMFQRTFYGCRNFTGLIVAGMFGTISGTPAANMFYGTFEDCISITALNGNGLFGTLSGAPANNMFLATFKGCSAINKIDMDILTYTSGATAVTDGSWFNTMFQDCGTVNSNTPTANTVPFWTAFPLITSSTLAFNGTTTLDNVVIPANWK